MYSYDYLKFETLIPDQIIDFIIEHGNFPKYFKKFSHCDLGNGVHTVYFLQADYLYYFTYSFIDDSLVWDLFHADEIKALKKVIL